MAIVKMKKLRLMAVRSEKEDLLLELERLGCVEFSEPDRELEDAGLVRENADVLSLRNHQNTLLTAIGLLDRYAPEKKPLLSAKPQVELETLLDEVCPGYCGGSVRPGGEDEAPDGGREPSEQPD